MAEYTLTPKQYDALMKKLNPDPVYPKYASLGDAMAMQDFQGTYSNVYICRGKDSAEANQKAHKAVASGGKNGSPVATGKAYGTEFGTTKILISTTDPKIKKAMSELKIKPEPKKKSDSYTNMIISALRDPEFRQHLRRTPQDRDKIYQTFEEMARSIQEGPKKAKPKKAK